MSESKVKTRKKEAKDGDDTDESVPADAPESGCVVGAFVHISRVAEEKVDDLEKLFKLGEKVGDLRFSCLVNISVL